MSVIPEEFNPENIKANSGPGDQMYREEINSQEPMKSVLEIILKSILSRPVVSKTGAIGSSSLALTTILPPALSTPLAEPGPPQGH